MKFYHPKRLYLVFSFLLTIFLLIKKKKQLLFFKPLKPKKLREIINKLGASFIKLAQVLATRADFFDEVYLKELKALHDEIPPMNKKDFELVFKRAFKSNIFKEFEKVPLASASIGQVHKAILHNGSIVAVKLRRENITKQVNADIKILLFFNRIFSPIFSFYTKNSIDSLIAEFSNMILKEVSFIQELSNLKHFSKKYANSGVHFPKPYEHYCSDDAIVMSFEDGIRFDDRESLLKDRINFHQIMEKLIIFYTEQMLVNGLFHADPHPGNLLIRKDGSLVLLDFGMVKQISNPTRVAIIEMIKSAHEEDFELYISSCKRLGIIAYEAPMDQMVELAQKMFDIFNNESLNALSMQELAFNVMASMRDFPFKLPQEAVFILRVSAIIEGLGTTYIENFNGIKDILPILQKNIPRALGANKGAIELIKNELSSMPLTIKQIHSTISKLSEDELRVYINDRQVEYIESLISKNFKKYKLSLVLILSSFFLLLYSPNYKSYALILFLFGILRVLYK